jgi:hypothetical protein
VVLNLFAALAYGQDTCSLVKDNTSNIVLKAAASNATDAPQIPVISILFDPIRKIPYTSSVIMDSLNKVKALDRTNDPFRMHACQPLDQKQQDCSQTMRLSESQKLKANGPLVNDTYNSWDRGHLVPVSPMRFSESALESTFFCPNIAPQEPWTNRCPWYAVEERTQAYLAGTKPLPGFVVTGTCAADSPDGDSYYGLKVPDCFYKVLCYVDAVTKKTVSVGFVGNNSIIDAKNLSVERGARMNSTLTPRDLEFVMKLSKPGMIKNALVEADKVLKTGRVINGTLPTVDSCMSSLKLEEAVRTQWTVYMPKYRRPMWSCAY